MAARHTGKVAGKKVAEAAAKASAKAPATSASWRHLSRPSRFAHLHVRLLISIAIGIGVATLAPATLATRALIGWDCAAVFYIVSTVVMMVRSDVGSIRRRAEAHDEGAAILLIATAAAAAASLAAIFAELAAAKGSPETYALHIGLAVVTILLSWFFIHIIFALHYAYEFYDEGPRGGGLEFPGEAQPNYADFMYFSLVIGMTSQVSDVAISDRAIRHTASAHGVFSFFFNTTVIALTVNIAGSVF